jgi:hypothetical protein
MLHSIFESCPAFLSARFFKKKTFTISSRQTAVSPFNPLLIVLNLIKVNVFSLLIKPISLIKTIINYLKLPLNVTAINTPNNPLYCKKSLIKNGSNFFLNGR